MTSISLSKQYARKNNNPQPCSFPVNYNISKDLKIYKSNFKMEH